MAQRRMFSSKIISSARFLKMPIDSQLLYFHLGMHADDDGVVEAYTVIRSIGANEDNLKVLVAKGLVKVLNEDLVAFITDWNEHNKLRADRKVDSIYKNLLLQIVPEVHLIEPKPRADTGQITGGRPLDAIGKDRLGKVSIGKDKIEKNRRFTPPSLQEVQEYCSERKNTINAETFLDFYTSKGWKIGKEVMKDWKASIRTWEKRDTQKQSNERILHDGTKAINKFGTWVDANNPNVQINLSYYPELTKDI